MTSIRDSGEEPLRVDEYELLAKARLPRPTWDFIAGGSGDEATVRANGEAFGMLRLRPSAMVDVEHCDTTTVILGCTSPSPVGVAPMAFQGLVHQDAEVATARGAGAAGTLMVVSLLASRTLEEIAAVATGPLWLQVYFLRRRSVLVDLLRRAEDSGYRALVVSVDMPRMGRRLRDVRNGFAVDPAAAAANIAAGEMASAYHPADGRSAVAEHARHAFDPSATWDDLAWIRDQTPLPLVVKGILTAADARTAVEAGADGLIVSNHGGRQCPAAVTGLEALPEVVREVAGRCPVFLDGGIRTGPDVVKALALGASHVFVGRPVLWGLAAAGAAGVEHVLELLRTELEDTLALLGRPTLSRLDHAAVTLAGAGLWSLIPTPSDDSGRKEP